MRLRKKSVTKCGVFTHQCNNIASSEGVGLPPRHVFGRMTLRRKGADAPATTVLTRLATRHDNDKWLNDMPTSTLFQARQRANACRTARTRPSRRLMCCPICRPFYRVTVGIWPLLRLRTKAHMLFSTDREEVSPNRRVCRIGRHPLGCGLQG